jgi:hypothetical protein
MLLKSLKSINRQVVIKFLQNWFTHEVKYYCLRSTNSLILFGIKKNCLISGRSLLLYQFTKKVTKLTVIIIGVYDCYKLHIKFYRISSSSLGIISVGFDGTDQLLIRFFEFVRYWRKKWEYNESVHQLFIYFKKAYDLVRREVLYNILIGFGVPMKLVRLIEMCLNETYSKVRIGKHLSASFPIQNGLKQGDAITPAFQLCFRICH